MLLFFPPKGPFITFEDEDPRAGGPEDFLFGFSGA